MFHRQEVKSRGICYLDSSIMSYCKISSFDAILPSTIFCTMIALSSSEMCCREIRGIMGIPETSPCCNHGSYIISCRLARWSGSRTRSLAINLQSYGTTLKIKENDKKEAGNGSLWNVANLVMVKEKFSTKYN